MSDRGRFLIITCVVLMAVGQVLFKQVALNYNKTENLFEWSVAGILVIAGILYVTSSGLWVWALRYMELSKAYPYFALAFVFVPLMGAWFFGDSLSIRYAIGVVMIISGVILTSYNV